MKNKLSLTAQTSLKDITIKLDEDADIHEVVHAMMIIILHLEYHELSLAEALREAVDRLTQNK